MPSRWETASGVGPEILLRRFADGSLGEGIVAYGDAAILARGAEMLGLRAPLHAVASLDEFRAGCLNVVDAGLLDVSDLTPGQLNPKAGSAALRYVERATHDALAGQVAAIVTLPMNKEATGRSHPGFIGHTETIASLCGTDDYAMMLATEDVAVTHVSTHVSLAEAISRVTPARVATVIRLTHQALARFLRRPRIAVCGLNPHAGENGLMGTEDRDIIAPTIAAARSSGLEVTGPHPADTVFYQAIHNDAHDAIVCMYHDQGHAPMKLIGFESGVNVTIGLPVIRTSVDHGTAFDIAWQGTAFTDSLGHALNYARRLIGDAN